MSSTPRPTPVNRTYAALMSLVSLLASLPPWTIESMQTARQDGKPPHVRAKMSGTGVSLYVHDDNGIRVKLSVVSYAGVDEGTPTTHDSEIKATLDTMRAEHAVTSETWAALLDHLISELVRTAELHATTARAGILPTRPAGLVVPVAPGEESTDDPDSGPLSADPEQDGATG